MSYYPLTFLRDRLVSRSFVILFTLATNLYLFDVFLEEYAKNSFSIELGVKMGTIFFGNTFVTTIYLLALLEAFGLSIFCGYVRDRIRAHHA